MVLVAINFAFAQEIFEESYNCSGSVMDCHNAFDDNLGTATDSKDNNEYSISIEYNNAAKQKLYATYFYQAIIPEECSIYLPVESSLFATCNDFNNDIFLIHNDVQLLQSGFQSKALPLACYNKSDVNINYQINLASGTCYDDQYNERAIYINMKEIKLFTENACVAQEKTCDGLDNDCDGLIDNVDIDKDSVNDCFQDKCLKTKIPEEHLSISDLKQGRHAVFYGNYFQTNNKGNILQSNYSLIDTYGCSCEQILDFKSGSNKGEYKFGCTTATLNNWMSSKIRPS